MNWTRHDASLPDRRVAHSEDWTMKGAGKGRGSYTKTALPILNNSPDGSSIIDQYL